MVCSVDSEKTDQGGGKKRKKEEQEGREGGRVGSGKNGGRQRRRKEGDYETGMRENRRSGCVFKVILQMDM